MVLIVFVMMIEYMGYIMVLNELIDWNYFKDLGLNYILVGDGMVLIIVGFVGGFLVIFYGENIGVLVIIWVYLVYVLVGVVFFVIFFFFVGKLLVLIELIFFLVIGGIFFFLFGVIVFFGFWVMIED